VLVNNIYTSDTPPAITAQNWKIIKFTFHSDWSLFTEENIQINAYLESPKPLPKIDHLTQSISTQNIKSFRTNNGSIHLK
jgi:4-hydroxyphenylpyruvate dioxygenase-like putative hemolysin